MTRGDVGTLKGPCRCRAATYAVADALAYAVDRHCSNCRRATGAALKPLASIAIEAIAVVEGAEASWRSKTRRHPASTVALCGPLLYAVVKGGTFAHVPMGTLVDVPSVRPTAHIVVGSKGAWFDVTDDLPQYEGLTAGG